MTWLLAPAAVLSVVLTSNLKGQKAGGTWWGNCPRTSSFPGITKLAGRHYFSLPITDILWAFSTSGHYFFRYSDHRTLVSLTDIALQIPLTLVMFWLFLSVVEPCFVHPRPLPLHTLIGSFAKWHYPMLVRGSRASLVVDTPQAGTCYVSASSKCLGTEFHKALPMPSRAWWVHNRIAFYNLKRLPHTFSRMLHTIWREKPSGWYVISISEENADRPAGFEVSSAAPKPSLPAPLLLPFPRHHAPTQNHKSKQRDSWEALLGCSVFLRCLRHCEWKTKTRAIALRRGWQGAEPSSCLACSIRASFRRRGKGSPSTLWVSRLTVVYFFELTPLKNIKVRTWLKNLLPLF